LGGVARASEVAQAPPRVANGALAGPPVSPVELALKREVAAMVVDSRPAGPREIEHALVPGEIVAAPDVVEEGPVIEARADQELRGSRQILKFEGVVARVVKGSAPVGIARAVQLAGVSGGLGKDRREKQQGSDSNGFHGALQYLN